MYSRVTFGDEITLGASGWTYNNTFVLYDHQTESIWYHLSGEDGLTCISGFYVDRKLAEFNSTLTRWSTWKNSNPGTKFLRPDSK